MTLDSFSTLACIGCFISANGYKLLAGTVGLSLLTAAFFVRQQRRASGRKGNAFEVVIDSDSRRPEAEATSRSDL